MAKNKKIIGNEEWCAFPSMGVPAIKARVDSGAKTSALHAFNIQRFERDNKPWVSFDIHPLANNRQVMVQCRAPVCDRRWVKSSSGVSEKRYVIKVPMQLGEFLWEVEVTLTNRDSMGYRMLLGRNAMQDHVLVDPSQGCYFGNPEPSSIEALYTMSEPAPAGLNIAILGNTVNELNDNGHCIQGYGNQRLVETAQERGHRMTIIDIKKTILHFSPQQADCYVGDNSLPSFDIVIPRFTAGMSHYACSLLQHFQQQGACAINSAQAIRQSRDLISTLQIMQQYQIPVLLHTFSASTFYNRQMIEQAGGAPLLIKSLNDNIDKPYVLAKTSSSAESIIHALHSKGSAIFAQEYPMESRQRFIRSLVINDKIVASLEKNINISGQQKAGKPLKSKEVSLTEHESQMVIKIAQIMNLVLAGVDIIRTHRGSVFFGITPNPGFQDIENTVDIHISQLLFIALEGQFQHKVGHHE